MDPWKRMEDRVQGDIAKDTYVGMYCRYEGADRVRHMNEVLSWGPFADS